MSILHSIVSQNSTLHDSASSSVASKHSSCFNAQTYYFTTSSSTSRFLDQKGRSVVKRLSLCSRTPRQITRLCFCRSSADFPCLPFRLWNTSTSNVHFPEDTTLEPPVRYLLRPFASVKGLHLFEVTGLRTANALATLSQESIMEVLPSLQNLFLLESEPSETIRIIAQFIFTRCLFGRSISVHYQQGGNWVAKLLREVDN